MKKLSLFCHLIVTKQCSQFIAAVLLIFTCLFPINNIAAENPNIKSINGNPKNEILINGDGFGSKCTQCEVIVDYGKGFKYSTPVKSWSDKNIKGTINDLGKGLNVQIYTKTANGESNKVKYAIKPIIVPARKLNRLVPVGSVQNLLMFEKKSDLAVGDKGEETYKVSAALPACNNKSLIFERAELVQKGRFGEAKIIASPNPGCTNCGPVKVRWYHEPTGNLHYQVDIYRREVAGICQDKVRR